MRFIEGESLRAAIARHHAAARGSSANDASQALALPHLLRRFLDVCNALSYAHHRGIVHRDLKPSNIMLGPYGETLLLDWGLAKPIGRPTESESVDRPEPTLRPSSGGSGSPTLGPSRHPALHEPKSLGHP